MVQRKNEEARKTPSFVFSNYIDGRAYFWDEKEWEEHIGGVREDKNICFAHGIVARPPVHQRVDD